MKKKTIIAISFLFVLGIAFNVYRIMPEGKNISAFLANLEALAEDDEPGIGSNTCPNGGQNTRGEAENKKWTDESTTDSEGKVDFNGKTYDFGASYKNKKVKFSCYSVECPGDEGGCILCNVWCNKK